jgi:3-hydroxyisobutyrate dehydrogenase
VSGGEAGSWSLTNYAPRMLADDFAPGFVVDHFVKDMGIALAEAKRARLALPGLALAEQLYVALQAQGHGRKGTQSLILALASLSDVDWEGR